jgi:hypothetical protein
VKLKDRASNCDTSYSRGGMQNKELLTFKHWVCNVSNTTSVTSGAGTAYPSETSKITPVFRGVRFPRSLIFCVVFYNNNNNNILFGKSTIEA